MKINNRRYIGCKTKLLDFIYDSVERYNISKDSVFADIFAGTGVVAYRFALEGYKTILNDTLFSNYVIYKTIFNNEIMRIDLLKNEINYFNSIDSDSLKANYFSNTYGGKYYSFDNAKKIGFIRDYIEENKQKYNEREYYYLITCLLYACDKIANTVGHFESYLHSAPKGEKLMLEEFEMNSNLPESYIYNEDANNLAKKINADIVYIDPPYNARQYVNFYHVLENLARWNKPTEFEGKSMKFKRDNLKSDYCRSKAPLLFEDLIQSLKCKLIVVSYNNTYNAKSVSSNNTISEDQIIEILSKKGNVTIKTIDYSAFNAGKTDLKNHKEYLYICEVF
ncbi:MAG: DNA adenine methylase [Bacilli bacterium]|nr:DNA adenine methylase [Bacilli bacterium]